MLLLRLVQAPLHQPIPILLYFPYFHLLSCPPLHLKIPRRSPLYLVVKGTVSAILNIQVSVMNPHKYCTLWQWNTINFLVQWIIILNIPFCPLSCPLSIDVLTSFFYQCYAIRIDGAVHSVGCFSLPLFPTFFSLKFQKLMTRYFFGGLVRSFWN